MLMRRLKTPDITLDLTDPDLFGNDAAEQEDREVLASYFVEKKSLSSFYLPKRRLAIVRARKGMGKSALLRNIDHHIASEDGAAFTVRAHGADLVQLADLSSTDPLILIGRWQQAICRLINLELAKRIRFAVTDSSMLIVESAELANYKERNFVGALLDRIKFKGIPLEISKADSKDAYRLLKAYSENVGALNAWLLIDDIDSTFLNTPDARIRVSTFFSTLRKLASEFEGLTIRVSVRTDVWTTIARADEAMDKCEQYAQDLTWSKAEFRTIQCKKILAYAQRHHPKSAVAAWSVASNAPDLLGLLFPKTLTWSGRSVPVDELVHRVAHGRPRWSGQLCRLAGRVAAAKGAPRILMPHVELVLPEFGKLRLDDLHREHQHQFSAIQGLTEAFARGGHIYETPELLSIIWTGFVEKHGGPASLPPLDGRPVQGPLELAHFLYRIGFISGRDVHPSGYVGYVPYEERPQLLANSINPDDGFAWDVHPSYRRHLGIGQKVRHRRP